MGAASKVKVAKMENGGGVVVNGYANGLLGAVNGHINGNGHAVVNGNGNGHENGYGYAYVDETQDAIMESQGESVPGTQPDDDPMVLGAFLSLSLF